MTAEVLAFPTTGQIRAIVEHEIPATVRTLPDRTAANTADAPLHQILRKAVVAYRQLGKAGAICPAPPDRP